MNTKYITDIQFFLGEIKKLEQSNPLSEDIRLTINKNKEKVQFLLELFFKDNNLDDAAKYIKSAPINISLLTIARVLNERGLKFQKRDKSIIVRYGGIKDFSHELVIEFMIDNGWLKCSSFLENYKIHCNNIEDFLNHYNSTTRFCKAYIMENNIYLTRFDFINQFWEYNDLKNTIFFSIDVMCDFIVDNVDKLKECKQQS